MDADSIAPRPAPGRAGWLVVQRTDSTLSRSPPVCVGRPDRLGAVAQAQDSQLPGCVRLASTGHPGRWPESEEVNIRLSKRERDAAAAKARNRIRDERARHRYEHGSTPGRCAACGFSERHRWHRVPA